MGTDPARPGTDPAQPGTDLAQPGTGLGPAGFPAHLVAIHGLAAACTLALVVIAAVTAAHG